MEDHTHFSDEAFVAAFRDGTLPLAAFSHQAHLRLAWLYLRQHGAAEAEALIQRDLQAFVARAGLSDKYHATLTVAAVRIVDHFQRQVPEADFADFLHHFPQFVMNFRGLLGRHYSPERLQDPQARAAFLPPDRMPFP